MASDKLNLKRISSLVDRQPLEAADSEVSELEATSKSVSPTESSVLLSGRDLWSLDHTLSKRVSLAFHKTQDKGGLPHDVDQKTIENIFKEIGYYTRQRVRKKSHKTLSINEPVGPTTADIASDKKENFRSSFADTISEPAPESILDSKDFINGQYFGFYIVFWLYVSIYILRHIIRSEFTDQLPLYKAPVYLTFTNGLTKIALIDLSMYLSIYVVYFIQVLCARNLIQWRKMGRALTSIYEAFFLAFWVYFVMEIGVKDQWIGRTFLILHMFVLLMKMHSYAFYNGYLWKILRELQFSERYLEKLHQNPKILPRGFEKEDTTKLLTRSIAFCKFELLHQSMTLEKANEKGALELDSETLCHTHLLFPSNINFVDFFMYTMYPTVLYTLVFARREKIRWLFVIEKIAAMVGIIFVMLLIAEYNLFSTMTHCNNVRSLNYSFYEKCHLFVITFCDIVLPMFLEYLLTFYLIWHVILNLIAEVTRYADRDFYGHWWSLLDWEEFSRLWNKPVHKFLLRHVYHSSISAFSLSKGSSVLFTFFISSVVHELMMYVVFRRALGFLFFFQMFQLPLILINKSPLLKNHRIIRNMVCLLGLMLAPGMIPSFYLVF